MRSRPERDRLDPASTALLVFDLLELYRDEIERSGVLPTAVATVERCRAAGVLVCFARAAHRPDGLGFTPVLADTDRWYAPWSSEHPQPTRPAPVPPGGYASLAELGQGPADVDVPKHRWSAFRGTVLDVVLRARGVETLLVMGGSTHVGVASTVYAARDLDYQVVVVRDACTGHAEARDFFLDTVFPRMVRVRTAEQVRQMLGR